MHAILARFAALTFALVTIVSLPARAGDWPQWRGPQRTGHAPANTPALSALPKEFKPLWKIPVGGGFSAPVVAGDKLIYLDERDGKELAHALDAASGKELWSVNYAESFEIGRAHV